MEAPKMSRICSTTDVYIAASPDTVRERGLSHLSLWLCSGTPALKALLFVDLSLIHLCQSSCHFCERQSRSLLLLCWKKWVALKVFILLRWAEDGSVSVMLISTIPRGLCAEIGIVAEFKYCTCYYEAQVLKLSSRRIYKALSMIGCEVISMLFSLKYTFAIHAR